MLNVLFFAQLREKLGQDSITVPHSKLTDSVTKLTDELISLHPEWSSTLNCTSTLVAVNQALVERSHSLHDGDEVAYFPPVTGG